MQTAVLDTKDYFTKNSCIINKTKTCIITKRLLKITKRSFTVQFFYNNSSKSQESSIFQKILFIVKTSLEASHILMLILVPYPMRRHVN